MIISALLQTVSPNKSNKQALSSFRQFHPDAEISIIVDGNSDFEDYSKEFNTKIIRDNQKCDPRGGLTFDTFDNYLQRINTHCLLSNSEYVVILEDDVMTYKSISKFPKTSCAGPRINPYSERLKYFLQNKFSSQENYGYGMSGGSIFKRNDFLKSFDNRPNFQTYSLMDNRIPYYSDVGLTLLFQISGFAYSEWMDVSEKFHQDPNQRIIRDSAIDHNDKRLYI
jgi:hypothetical protein